MFRCTEGTLSNFKTNGSLFIKFPDAHCVACITLHNFIRQECQRDWLFQQYNNEDLIVQDSDNEDDDDIRWPD